MENFIRGKDFKYYDMLKAAQEGLKKDFFAEYPNYEDPKGTYLITKNGQLPYLHSWKVYPIKYTPKYYDQIKNDIEYALKFAKLYKEKFPTAAGLIDHFGDDVNSAAYLVMEAGAWLDWHYDIENLDGELLCVHIPLDIPDGDLALDVDGDIIRWEDIFAFNNQKIHRAWNKSDKHRLVFLLDFTKKSCGVT